LNYFSGDRSRLGRMLRLPRKNLWGIAGEIILEVRCYSGLPTNVLRALKGCRLVTHYAMHLVQMMCRTVFKPDEFEPSGST